MEYCNPVRLFQMAISEGEELTLVSNKLPDTWQVYLAVLLKYLSGTTG